MDTGHHINYVNFIYNHVLNYPSPANLSYLWNFGFISSICLSTQLISGFFLSIHYCSDVSVAFASVEHIMRDVNYGWFLRYLHANGASFFFFAVYIHIASNMYFQLFTGLNTLVWVSGVLLFILMMASGFIGYVLPWGQMSFWGATVITNLFSAVPWFGMDLVYWLWGGFSVGGPTLSRFFAIHYILPFVLLVLTLLHISFLHEKGSSNPSWLAVTLNSYYLPLYPYFIINDLLGLFVFLLVFSFFLFFAPDTLGHSDNYIEANPLSTPAHIVPEWYFLPFYAILSAIPDKQVGICCMFSAIANIWFLPSTSWNFFSEVSALNNTSYVFNVYVYPFFNSFFFATFLLLGWLGAQPVEEPYIFVGSVLSYLYFVIIYFNIAVLPDLFCYLCESSDLVEQSDLDEYFEYSIECINEGLSQINNVWSAILAMITSFIPINMASSNNLTNWFSSPIVMQGVFVDSNLWDSPYEFFYLIHFFAFSIFIICIFVIGLLFASLFLSDSTLNYNHIGKHNSFECGFDPINVNSSFSINIYYFNIALVFLIFDLELLFLIPWLINLKFFLLEGFFYFYLTGSLILLLVILGLIYEYLNHMTDWQLISSQ